MVSKIYNEDGVRVCGAKNHSDKQPCQNNKIMANGRCRLHGGKAKGGALAASYRHGKFSKILPAGLAEKYNELLNDDEIYQSHAQIALLNLRLQQLLERANSGDIENNWKALNKVHQKVLEFISDPDKVDIEEIEEGLDKLKKSSKADQTAWKEIISILQVQNRLVVSERSWLIENKQLISIGEVSGLFEQILNIILIYVIDPETRTLIAEAIYALIGGKRHT